MANLTYFGACASAASNRVMLSASKRDWSGTIFETIPFELKRLQYERPDAPEKYMVTCREIRRFDVVEVRDGIIVAARYGDLPAEVVEAIRMHLAEARAR